MQSNRCLWHARHRRRDSVREQRPQIVQIVAPLPMLCAKQELLFPAVCPRAFTTPNPKRAADHSAAVCTQFNPAKRITAREALRHPYVAQFHSSADEPSAPGIITIPIDDNTKACPAHQSRCFPVEFWLVDGRCTANASLPCLVKLTRAASSSSTRADRTAEHEQLLLERTLLLEPIFCLPSTGDQL